MTVVVLLANFITFLFANFRLLCAAAGAKGKWMADSYTNLLYHIIFSTKYRRPLITPEYEIRLYDYIGGTVRGEGGVCLELNCASEHLPLLLKLPPDHAFSAILPKLKAKAS